MMNLNPYDSSERARASVTDQAAQEAEHELTRTPAGSAGQAAANGAAPAGPGALHTISAGIRSGISPLQFMDSIDAGGQQMGNRAFMHWVEQVHTGTADGATHGIAAQGLQGPGRPLTHLDTLQQAFGHHDIRAMREHTGTVAGSALDALDAEGYTRGGRMALAGAPDLYTQAHEAAHGVQQAALGERMMLPGGIGVAGDRYERQADAVADAVLRGESAQPLLDQVTAGPVQVSAASAGAAAPVQMRRKKHKRRNQPRPEDIAGAGMPDLGQVAQQLENLTEEVDVPQLAGSMDVQQVEGAVGNVAEDIVPAPQQPDQENLPDAGGPNMTWEELEQYMADTAQPETDGKLDRCLKYLEEISDIKLTKLRTKDTRAEFFFPQAQPEDRADVEREEPRDTLERYFKYFFPLIAYLHEALEKRAGQINTDDHGVLSLRGILNALATVMLGVFMVGAALPLDVVGNMLGVVARVLLLICDITAIPGNIWLRRLGERGELEEEPAEADNTGRDWKKVRKYCYDFLNVFIPQALVSSAVLAYFHASIMQGSLSPSLWLLEWTPERIGLICGRVILDNIIAIVLINLSSSFDVLLHGMLGWHQTLATLFPTLLANILNIAGDYTTAYSANPEITVFQPWLYVRTGVGVGEETHSVQDFDSSGVAPRPSEIDTLTPNETTATFLEHSVVCMLITFVAATLVLHYVKNRMLGESLIPWLSKFHSIRNRSTRTIAVALASMRNAMLTVMAVTNIMGLVVANIIGPLSREFGSTGFCLWPMAAAGACGGAPDDFDFISLSNHIKIGQEQLPESHLRAIQTFPGMVGALGLGIPIAIVLIQFLRKYSDKIKKKLKDKFKPRRRGAGSGERISLAEEGGIPGSRRPLPPIPQQAAVTVEQDPPGASAQESGGAGPAAVGTHSPQLSITSHASAVSIHSNEAQLRNYLLYRAGTRPGLYEHDMESIVNSWVEQRRINEREAERVKEWAKDTLLFRR